MNKSYLSKHAVRNSLVPTSANSKLGIVVTIPAYNELEIIRTLNSLKSCNTTKCDVEVIVLINASECSNDSLKNLHSTQQEQCERWARKNNTDHLSFYILLENELPAKQAGVGLVRKILMDEAVRRFENSTETNQLIVTLDADSIVDSNYLVEIEAAFTEHPNSDAANIYYEHPLSGDEFKPAIYNAILYYELHLRYYKQGVTFSQHPFHFHAIGSAIVVRNQSYQKFGGMNTRQAGEDFYFLQKVSKNGIVFDITKTCVRPSSRSSNRVPFGTGKAVAEIIDGKDMRSYTFHPDVFIQLHAFFSVIPDLFKDPMSWRDHIPVSMRIFLEEKNIERKLLEIKKNTSSLESFKDRFFRWFDALLLLQYAHHYRDNEKANISIDFAAQRLLKILDAKKIPDSPIELLETYRKMDRNSVKYPLSVS